MLINVTVIHLCYNGTSMIHDVNFEYCCHKHISLYTRGIFGFTNLPFSIRKLGEPIGVGEEKNLGAYELNGFFNLKYIVFE